MDVEIDRMMLLRRISIICLIVLVVAVGVIAATVVLMSTGDYSGANSDFAEIEDYGAAVTKRLKIEKCEYMYFFSEELGGRRTLFTDEIPNLKIVNSDKYLVEVKASQGLIDKLDVSVKDNALMFTFKEEIYNVITRGSSQYKGLYIDCDAFDVTVYAPISRLASSSEINLDFDVAAADLVAIIVSGEVRSGKIYNVNSETLVCSMSGESDIEVSGKVRKTAHFEAFHSSEIDAENLITPKTTATVSSQLFAFSYVDGYEFFESSITSMGFLITVALVLFLIAIAVAYAIFQIKFLKQKKELDLYIEKVETEGKFLDISKKTDENVLQNSD